MLPSQVIRAHQAHPVESSTSRPLLQRCGGVRCPPGTCDHDGGEPTLQRHAIGPGPELAPPIVHEVLRTPGQPLDGTTQAGLGSTFGRDFSHVRVHTDAQAARSAHAVRSRAYTVGSDIVFGRGQYNPGTDEGRRLLAHELTHVVQQRNAHRSASASAPIPVGPVDSPREHEAARHAAGAAAGSPTGTSGGVLQRRSTDAEDTIHKPLIDRYWRERGTTADAVAGDPTVPSPGQIKYREIPREAPVWCMTDTLCGKDPAIVDKVRQNLQVTVVDRIDVQKWTFDNFGWGSQTVHPSGFSQHGSGSIGLVSKRPCEESVQTLVHEVRHQAQPAAWTDYQKELDAYVFAEAWTIRHGLPGRPGLRAVDPKTGAVIPNRPAIEGHVRKRYGTPATTAGEEVVGHRHPDTTVLRQPNGTTRTRRSYAGDAYLADPPTLVGEWRVPPYLWTCPTRHP